MFNKSFCLPKIAILATALTCSTLQAAAPQGWILAGSKPANYDTGIDSQAKYQDAESAYLKSKADVGQDGEGFGTLMQSFRATRYLGKRLRVSGFIKSEGVHGWAGLWMRVDKNSTVVGFDNMENRPIKGTNDWRRYDVVLDVPEDATGIALGVLLAGPGTVWLNNTKFEVVESNVPVTGNGARQPDAPTNLDFQH
jgi:hypothetical protein